MNLPQSHNCYVYGHYKKDTGIIFYIGISLVGNTNTSTDEQRKYKRAYSVKNRNKHWHHIVKKHDYTVQILHENLDEQTAFDYEKGLILFYGRSDIGTGILCNKTDGGEGTTGKVFTAEYRAKISEAMKGNTNCLGHKPTPYNRRRVLEAHLGSTHTPEAKAKMSAAKKGKTHSPEARAKISEAMKGKQNALATIHTTEARANMSAARKGKTATTEARANMSAARVGMVFSLEHKANISAASKAAWARRKQEQAA